MTTNHRAARRQIRERRRATVQRRIDRVAVTAVHARRAIRPARPPLVLHVAVPRDLAPGVRTILDEAARRIAERAQVRFTLLRHLPDDAVVGIILPCDGAPRPRPRWVRAVMAFLAALEEVAAERLDEGAP